MPGVWTYDVVGKLYWIGKKTMEEVSLDPPG